MLTFDEAKHIYYWHDEEVPGVTTILKTLGLSKSYDNVDPYYRDRGKAVHKAIELDIHGILDLSTLHEDCVPYFKAWKKFCKKTGYSPLFTEKRYYHEGLKYACTIDNFGKRKKETWLIEVKCTESSDKASDLQLCGQDEALTFNSEPPDKKAVVELHKNGDYDILFSDTHPSIWISVMDLYRWKLTKRSRS